MRAQLALSALLALVGCGGDDGGDEEPTCLETVRLLDYELSPSAVTGAPGALTLCARNDGQAPHDLAVRDATGNVLGRTPVLKPGESARLALTLPAASYAIFCTQAGHESLGMKGTLELR